MASQSYNPPNANGQAPTQFNELDEYLKSLEREQWYRVEKVLKKSEGEETQLVYYPSPTAENPAAEVGPFIRKYIKCNPDEVTACEEIYRAQHRGIGFGHIPVFLESFRNEDSLVVVMTYIEGPTLDQIIRDSKDSAGLAVQLFPMICDAVTELHTRLAQPIIHRDLKPTNIVVGSDGVNGIGSKVTLIDLGISRAYKAGAMSDTTFVGTREYAPPEQFGYGQTDTRTDVYALGMVLYFMLTGENPRLTIQQEARPSAITKQEWEVIMKATRLMPNERHQSVAELKADASRALKRRNSVINRVRRALG